MLCYAKIHSIGVDLFLCFYFEIFKAEEGIESKLLFFHKDLKGFSIFPGTPLTLMCISLMEGSLQNNQPASCMIP